MANRFTRKFKNFLKYHFYILKVYRKFSPEVQIAQRQLFHYYQECARSGNIPALSDTGFRVFTQFEEDGILLFLFAVVGTRNKTFVEIGSDDGVNSNCANLVLNLRWHGLFIDADKSSIRRGRHFYRKYPTHWSYPPKFLCNRVTRENINQLIADAGFTGEVDFLCIDIDGNDYWIWDTLQIISPRVVMIETHVEFGYHNIVVPYDPDYTYPGRHPVYHGASPVAMNQLANRKGYRLVGANSHGFNAIFVRNNVGTVILPEVPVKSILQHPATIDSFKLFEPIKDWEYITEHVT
ncbi:MAG: hypothetical protein V1733_07695 [bacterium]